MKSTVLHRALLYVLLPMLAAHVLVTALHVQEKREARQAATEQRVEMAAQTIAATINPADSTASVRLAAVAELQDFARLWLVDDRGALLASSIPSERGSVPDADWSQAIRKAGSTSGGTTRFLRGGTPYLLATRPVNQQGVQAVAIYDTTLAGSLATLWALTFLPGALLYLLLAFVLLMFITLAVQRPVEKFEAALGRLTRGDAEDEATLQRLHAELQVGLGQLADRFLEIGREFALLRMRYTEVDRRSKAVAELVSELVLVCSFKGFVVEVNPAFCKFIGCQPGDLHGQPFQALEPYFKFSPLLSMAQRSLAQGVAFEGVEFTVRDHAGRPFPVRAALRALPMEDGPIFVLVASDLTSQKTLEQRLHEVADSVQLAAVEARPSAAPFQLLERIIEAPGVLVVAFDHSGQTVFWNHPVREITGLHRSDVPDRATALPHLISEAEQERLEAWLDNEHDAFLTSLPTEHAGSRRVLWHVARVPVAPKEDPGLVLIGLDVTQVQHRLAALPSDKELPPSPSPSVPLAGDPALAYLTAYELHAPVKSTIGFAELLAQHVEADPETALYLDLIRQTMARMARLLESVLAYGRSGSINEVSAWLDAGVVAEEALSRAVPAELPDGRSVHIETPASWPRLWGHRAQLVIALEHLLAQALLHDASEPTIEIGARDVKEGTVLWVATNGPAFPETPPEQPSAPFKQPLYQAGDDASAALSVCGGIVALHGGKAWVEHEDGTSKVFLFLPHYETPPVSPARDRVSEILDALDDADL